MPGREIPVKAALGPARVALTLSSPLPAEPDLGRLRIVRPSPPGRTAPSFMAGVNA